MLIGGPYISVGKCSAHDVTMSKKLNGELTRKGCGGATHLELLCTVDPPSNTLVPPGPPAASLAKR